jgi:hypothetical protein
MKRPGRCGVSNLLNSEETLQDFQVMSKWTMSASGLDLFRGTCNVLNGDPQVADHGEFRSVLTTPMHRYVHHESTKKSTLNRPDRTIRHRQSHGDPGWTTPLQHASRFKISQVLLLCARHLRTCFTASNNHDWNALRICLVRIKRCMSCAHRPRTYIDALNKLRI